ncbi:MAG: FliO/MopB family protein, partial [Rubrivivax sp.]
MEGFVVPLLWLVVIVASIPVVLWLLRRTPAGGAAAGSFARTVGVLPLSGTHRLVTVEVGSGEDRRWLVLGVTPSSVQTLHVMPPQQQEPGSEPRAP